MTTNAISPRNRTRAGATLVEFAVVLPVVMLFFAAMVETSRALLLRHTADTAAYEGARSGMVPGATTEQARQAAQALLDAAGLRRTSVSVTPEELTEESSLITVHVEVPVTSNSWIAPVWFTRGSVVSEVTLFCERPPLVQLTAVPAIKAKKTKAKTTTGL
jgi:Flp pilus assembly protein TadG